MSRLVNLSIIVGEQVARGDTLASSSDNLAAPPSSSAAAAAAAAASVASSANECGQLEDLNDSAYEEHLYVSLSTFWYCFLAFITTMGLVVSLVSNTIIIYLFTKTPSLRRNPSNIIAVNLSLSDLLYCTQWPSVIYCSLTQSTWMLEINLLCQTFGFLTVSTALASILTVLAMSIERAIVIGYSIHAKSRFTIRGAWLVVVLIWIMSICSCLPPLFGKFNRYTLDPSKTSCTLDYLSSKTNHKLYILVLYIAYWIAPAIMITICYIAIIVTFKRSSTSLKLVERPASDPQASTSSSCASAFPPCASTLPTLVSAPSWSRSSLSTTRAPLFASHEPAPTISASEASVGASKSSPTAAASLRPPGASCQEEGGGGGGGGGGGSGDASRKSRKFDFKLSPRRLRDSIRLKKLPGCFVLCERNEPPSDQCAPVAKANQLEWQTASGGGGGALANKQLRRASEGAIVSPKAAQVDTSQPDAGMTQSVTNNEANGRACGQARVAPAGRLDVSLTSSQRHPEALACGRRDGVARKGRLNKRLATFCGARTSSSRLIQRFASNYLVEPAPDDRVRLELLCGGGGGGGSGRGGEGEGGLQRELGKAAERVTAGAPDDRAQTSPRGRRHVAIMRSRTSQELRIGRRSARLSDATVTFASLGQAGGGLSHATSHFRLHGHKLTSAICNFVTRNQHLGTTETNSSQLQHKQQQQQQQPSSSGLSSSSCYIGSSSCQLSRTSLQIRLAKMAFYLILLWFVSWTPIASLAMINSVVKCHHRASALAVFTANTMTKLGPAFDVFIYGISHPKIKSKFKEIIKWLLMIGRNKRQPDPNGHHATQMSRRSQKVSVRSNARPMR